MVLPVPVSLFAALAGVVVDHVEDHLEARGMQAGDHVLKLRDPALGQEARLRREKAQRLVAPVIDEPTVGQEPVVEKGVDGQQFHRGDAETGVVLQHRIGRDAEKGARVGHVAALHGQALGVAFVDHGVGDRRAGRRVGAPAEGGILDHAARHEGRAVAAVEGQVGLLALGVVAVERVVPDRMARQALGVGIDQELVGIEAVAAGRGIFAVHPVAVKRTGLQA
jgi:hypothetical protein